MSGIRRGLMLLAFLVAMTAVWVNTAAAQVTTTTVQDTVYSANGTPASGTVLVSWSAFTTAGGQEVPAGSTSVTIGAGGVLTVALAPNAGSTPMGSYYTAVFHLSDGTTSREYWVVPAAVPGGAPATLATIKNEVLPASVAMQTVSKAYVDDSIAAAASGFPLATSPYVLTAGDAMSGPLTLAADPVNANQAANKHYVDVNVAAVSGEVGQKVSLLPTGTQTVAQPSGTSFAIAGTNTTTTFGGGGTNTTMVYTTPGSPQMIQRTLQCSGQGYDLGNNGTSAQGWSTCAMEYDNFAALGRGITQAHSTVFTHSAIGDTSADYTYLDTFGGKVAASDEGVEHTVMQNHQIGYMTGTVATGGTSGSNLISTSAFACHGYCETQAGNSFQFADGGMLLDTSKGGATATLASYTHDTTNQAMMYTLASGTVPVSTAWGNIVPASCTPNGNGQNQAYTSTTCNVTLSTSPASPGNFVAGTDVCMAGPFQEEAAVTAVGTTSGGVQSITFSTRYAYNWYQATFVMQGGLCGQAFVATSGESSWPIAYQALGATSSTTPYFSNCVDGGCNGGNTGNIIQSTSNSGGSISRTSNVVTMTGVGPFNEGIYQYPVGSSLTVAGYTPSDLNGTFTVVSNTFDSTNPVITWAQAGPNESSTANGKILQVTSITFYPMAFITGTNGGVAGDAQLATNTVPFAAGDTVAGAPTSEWDGVSLRIVQGQTTSVDGSQPSSAISVQDDGPSPLPFDVYTGNNIANGVSGEAFLITGSYGSDFNIGYRPANNGAVIYMAGGEPVSSNQKPYSIFQDNKAGTFGLNPLTQIFSLSGGLTVPEVTATGSASSFAAGTKIGGLLPCLQNGTNCPAGSGGGSGGGTGTVSSVGMGAWPSWLTPTVTNATTTPAVAVTASAIPNAALANSSTTVNGQSCALGGTCTITAAPAAEVKYYQAAVCDAGVAYASGVTRYDNQQPQAGCVLPASSALGYLAFNAAAAAPQYAEATVSTPPYWTGTGLYLNFYSAAVTGTVTWEVQTACVSAGSAVGAPVFGAAVAVTATVSAAANGDVATALAPGIATPGGNGCPATPTSPGLLTYRIYRSATDTAAGNANLLGVTLVTGRSQ